MKKAKRPLIIVLCALGVVLVASVVIYFHGPGVQSAKGPFVTAAQAKQIAQQRVSATSGSAWTKDSRVTFVLPEYDLSGNAVMYDCRVETNGKPTGDISVMTQNGGAAGSANSGSGQAVCDRKLQTVFKRDAQENDYLINAAQCGYDIALKNADGGYTVAEMNGKPKKISEKQLLWHAWFYKNLKIPGWA